MPPLSAVALAKILVLVLVIAEALAPPLILFLPLILPVVLLLELGRYFPASFVVTGSLSKVFGIISSSAG
jgi:hypothetical protein